MVLLGAWYTRDDDEVPVFGVLGMSQVLSGKVGVVTGASSGIGRATAVELAAGRGSGGGGGAAEGETGYGW